MTMTVPHTIACIGAGYWGKNLIRNFASLGVLAWVCELDADSRAHLAIAYPAVKLTDAVEQVLADPAVAGVAIATPSRNS
jgi:UDP-2-acetamido-3-amino-2,3-dideoxy-glucuronate N-acetyltransferase